MYHSAAHNGAALTFFNEHGQSSRGRFTASGMTADDWQQVSAQVEENGTRISWSNGAAWFKTPRGQTGAMPPPSAVRYLGCFRDTSAFDLDGFLVRSRSNTPEACVSQCRQRGFTFAAVQYGESCLCGNSYGKYGASHACTMPCTGNPAQACGGINANAVYTTGLR